MEDQSKQTLDLSKLSDEKINLINLIRPAIDQFILNTGQLPDIHVSQTSTQTNCGIVKGHWEISVSVSI